jgi:hypothetical protein
MVAWVLNLDAEDELAAKGGAHTRSRAMHARILALVPRLSGLVGPGDVVLAAEDDEVDDRRAAGVPGDAWCPTPRALDRLRRAGALVPAAPPPDVLRAVNGRGFSAALGQPLRGAAYVTREDDAVDVLDHARGPWLAKRPLGFAGRGRRKLAGGALSREDRAWLAASVREHGGLQIEPLVQRLADFGIHGRVAAGGELHLGAPTVQAIDENGAWLSTHLAAAGELEEDEARALRDEAFRAGDALHRAGYFGPFGVDAYRYRDAAGDARFNPRSEINARYSMGFAIGFAAGQKQT